MLRSSRIITQKVTNRLSSRYLSTNSSLNFAIIGSGPSAFYTAKYLLDSSPECKLDIYERLPFPYGLVRYGVAPDHQEVKSVTSTFEQVLDHKDRVNFYGNVTIHDKEEENSSVNSLDFKELYEAYDGVVLAYGATSDHKLNLDKEDELEGILSARTFVNWYNGHPHYPELPFAFENVKNVVIVGQGNVAIDCARVLIKNEENLVSNSDISLPALQILKKDYPNLENITIIGRRGHGQASFTIKELRELTRLPEGQVLIPLDDIQKGLTEATKQEIQSSRPKKRITDLMETVAAVPLDESKKKFITIRFLLTPHELRPSESNPKRIGSLVVKKNQLVGLPNEQKAVETDEIEELPCDLLLTSIGYKSESISSLIPFHPRRSIVNNSEGRVLNEANEPVPALYVSGWLKRGPSGIIGTNINDAKETCSSILEDIRSGSLNSNKQDNLEKFKQKNASVFAHSLSYQDIQKLNQYELQKGEEFEPKRIRQKILSSEEMVKLAKEL